MLCNRNAAGVLAVDYVFHLFRQLHLDFADNLAVLDYVLSTSTNFVLKKYKENGMVLAEEKKDERIIVSA